jgi:hypothetical protein
MEDEKGEKGRMGQNKWRVGGTAAQLAGTQTYKGCYDVTEKIGIVVLVFINAKQFLRKLSAIWAQALTNIRQSSPMPKSLRNIGFKRRPLTSVRPSVEVI